MVFTKTSLRIPKLRINLSFQFHPVLKLKMRLKHIILTTCLFSSTLAMAELPQDSRRPGGIAVIPLTSDITQVTFQHKPVLISQEGQQRYAVFGIPLSTPLGSVQLDTNKALFK